MYIPANPTFIKWDCHSCPFHVLVNTVIYFIGNSFKNEDTLYGQ